MGQRSQHPLWCLDPDVELNGSNHQIIFTTEPPGASMKSPKDALWEILGQNKLLSPSLQIIRDKSGTVVFKLLSTESGVVSQIHNFFC